MEKNVGNLDRALRAIIGISLIAIGAFSMSNTILRVILIVLGIGTAGTAVMSHCAVYKMLGINTAGK